METISIRSTTTNGTLADYQAGQAACVDKLFTFIVAQKEERPGMTTGADQKGEGGTPVYYPPLYKIPGQDIILDRKTNKRRAIRYVPGESTIFVDQMSEIAQKNPIDFKIKFERGQKIVPGHDWPLLEYMFHSNWNVKKEGRIGNKPGGYYLLDKESIFEEAINNDKILNKVKTWCHNADADEVLRFSRSFLGTSWVLNKTIKEVRYGLINIAMANPTKFAENLKDERIKRKGIALDAIDRDVLIVNRKGNFIAWASNPGTPIVTAPMGADPLQHLIETTFTEQGAGIMDMLIRQLMPDGKKAEVLVPKEDLTNINYTGMDSIQADILFNDLVNKGILKKAGPAWWEYGDQKYRKGELISAIQSDSGLLALLKAEAKMD